MSGYDEARIELGVYEDDGTTIFPMIPSVVFFAWYDVISRWGEDRALAMVEQAFRVFKGDVNATDTARLYSPLARNNVTDAEREDCRRWLRAIKSRGDAHGSLEELVVSTCYWALKDGRETRAQALELARNTLGPSITADRWRKRVDRWAEKNELPPLELPRGRPRKK